LNTTYSKAYVIKGKEKGLGKIAKREQSASTSPSTGKFNRSGGKFDWIGNQLTVGPGRTAKSGEAKYKGGENRRIESKKVKREKVGRPLKKGNSQRLGGRGNSLSLTTAADWVWEKRGGTEAIMGVLIMRCCGKCKTQS